MRTTPFLATLFAVSLFGGAALAEKPAAVERLRARGDVVDKSYRSAERHAVAAARAPERNAAPSARPMIDRGASRVRCSDVGTDCPTARGPSARQSPGEGVGAAGNAGHPLRAPAFLDKVLGSDRTSFNEAGEEQGMSSRAAKRAWSHAGGAAAHSGASAAAKVPLANMEQRARTDGQASDVRMACNEGDQCMASSKATKKEWSYQAVKAGTWKGPEAAAPSNAERAIKAAKDQKADAAKKGQ